MGLFDKKEEKKENEVDGPVGKYEQPCSLCNKSPTDKHWGGQYFHKKCFRKLKKGAKGMI